MSTLGKIDLKEMLQKNGLWYYTEVRPADGTYLVIYRWDEKLKRKFIVTEFLL